MSAGNLIFVACWFAFAAWAADVFSVWAILVQYLLTGVVMCPVGGTWRTIAGWLPAFVSPRIFRWTRHE